MLLSTGDKRKKGADQTGTFPGIPDERFNSLLQLANLIVDKPVDAIQPIERDTSRTQRIIGQLARRDQTQLREQQQRAADDIRAARTRALIDLGGPTLLKAITGADINTGYERDQAALREALVRARAIEDEAGARSARLPLEAELQQQQLRDADTLFNAQQRQQAEIEEAKLRQQRAKLLSGQYDSVRDYRRDLLKEWRQLKRDEATARREDERLGLLRSQHQRLAEGQRVKQVELQLDAAERLVANPALAPFMVQSGLMTEDQASAVVKESNGAASLDPTRSAADAFDLLHGKWEATDVWWLDTKNDTFDVGGQSVRFIDALDRQRVVVQKSIGDQISRLQRKVRERERKNGLVPAEWTEQLNQLRGDYASLGKRFKEEDDVNAVLPTIRAYTTPTTTDFTGEGQTLDPIPEPTLSPQDLINEIAKEEGGIAAPDTDAPPQERRGYNPLRSSLDRAQDAGRAIGRLGEVVYDYGRDAVDRRLGQAQQLYDQAEGYFNAADQAFRRADEAIQPGLPHELRAGQALASAAGEYLSRPAPLGPRDINQLRGHIQAALTNGDVNRADQVFGLYLRTLPPRSQDAALQEFEAYKRAALAPPNPHDQRIQPDNDLSEKLNLFMQ